MKPTRIQITAQSIILIITAFACLSRAVASDCTPSPSGIVAWWPGDGNAYDIVGTNNGILLGGATASATGIVAQAFSFNGASSFVDPNTNRFFNFGNGSAPFTIEAWINPAVLPAFGWSFMAGFFNEANGLAGWGFGFYANGSMYFSSLGSSEVASGPGVIAAGVWSHVVVTSTGNTQTLYRNGVQVASGGPQSWVAGNAPLTFGYSYMGLLDEVSIYNRALTPSEIATIYQAGSAGKCKAPQGWLGATARASVVNGFVVQLDVTYPGFAYTNTPSVRIIGGGGSGAQAVAVVSNNVVSTISVLSPGNGYTNAPIVVVAPPFIPRPTISIRAMSLISFTNLTQNTTYQLQRLLSYNWTDVGDSFSATNSVFTNLVAGTPAITDYRLGVTPVPQQAIATGNVVNGFLVGVDVVNGGTGYTNSPAVTILNNGAGTGTNAKAVASISSSGVVTNISITSPGSGYVSGVNIVIDPPPAIFLSPNNVAQVMELDFGSVSPYDNYEVEYAPKPTGPWTASMSFTPTSFSNTQYISPSGTVGFFRAVHLPY